MGSVHRATVARVQPYGLFVRLEGYRKNGLVHAFQVRLPALDLIWLRT